MALEPLGITVERLAGVAGHLASAREVLLAEVARAATRHVRQAAGALHFAPRLAGEAPEVRRLLVSRAVGWMVQEPYLPRADELGRFAEALMAGRAATLSGCRAKGGWLMREARAIGSDVPVGEVWDRRWRVAGPPGRVRALGPRLGDVEGWRTTGLPREVLEVTPGVWQDERLVSAPLAGWENGWTAQLDAPDHLFGLSD
jgi:tRNA(Ile)-lysidine synthase